MLDLARVDTLDEKVVLLEGLLHRSQEQRQPAFLSQLEAGQEPANAKTQPL